MGRTTVIILSALFSLLQTLQAQQPRFTNFRTAEEIENEDWQDKITDEAVLENYILQLVTSREKLGDNQWICVQVLDKRTRQLVQEMKLGYSGRGDSFEIGDYNFDGYKDFSLLEGCGTLDNFYSAYFLFDPETKTFFNSGFDGTNLEFDSSSKTITSSSRCCAGASAMYQTFKLVDNRMILIEQRCLDLVESMEEELEFKEVDCGTPYLDVQLQSVGLKKNFQLRMAVYYDDMAGGFVLYEGQKERIPIYLDRSEPIKDDEKMFYYNELHNGEINGVYSFAIRGSSVIGNVDYLRKKDGKRFTLKILL